jgi:hypothetical protein
MFKLLTFGVLLAVLCGYASAQEKQPPMCPTISISGPVGGEPNSEGFFTFDAEVSGTVPNGSTYNWTVSKGSIIAGQGTPTMKVVADWKDGTLTATLEITGLPKACPNTASESTSPFCPTESILIDEFSVLISKLEKERFKSAVTEQKNNHHNQLYIIEYYNDTSQFSIREKVRRLTEFLTKEMKLDESFFTIVTEKADKPLTKIYRIPPGAANPVP